ncbi:MAG: ribosome maturation factor RimM [Propionibacteriaceae bacterium]
MSEFLEVIVGVVGRPHGVRGEVTVDPRTDEPERRFAPGAVLREENGRRRFTVEGMRMHQGRLLVAFEEILDRNGAEAARGVVLVCDVIADEEATGDEEYYDRHLIGLKVLRTTGEEVGVVTAVQHMPVQDLLHVRTSHGIRLVPFTRAVVPTVDLAAKTCTLGDIGGLIDDTEAEEAR